MPKRKIDLVIFDCDGVLVDSEPLSARVLMRMLAEIGMPINDEIFRNDFLGRSFPSAAARLEARTGKKIPDDFQERQRDALLEIFETELKPINGARDVMLALSVPYCVASSSNPARLAKSLRLAGYADLVGERAYSSASVKHAKPAPDLFLHAAAMMNTTPQNCIVIEDSEMGLRAAAAAQMRAWHFVGGGHMVNAPPLPADVYAEHTITTMPALLDLFQQQGIAV